MHKMEMNSLEQHEVEIDYTNWKGERGIRRIRPVLIWFGKSEYHAGDAQWFVYAFDLGKGAHRDFTMSTVHNWKPVTP